MIAEKTITETKWHSLSAEEVTRRLGVDPAVGLDERQARARLDRIGLNTIGEVKRPSNWKLLVSQFKSLVILLLLVAAAISFAVGETLDGIAIMVAVLLNAGIGFATESRAERALEALGRLAAPTAHVLRESAEAEIPATHLVPGDIIILSAGGRVPADARLLQASNLAVDESPLTGESVPAEKYPCQEEVTAPVTERHNMVFLGTTVVQGHGVAVVTSTGAATEMGQIGRLVAETPHEMTPLEHAIENLGRRLIWVILVAAIVVIAVGLWHDEPPLLMLETGVVLAIAAVPEGLPAVTTIALAWGLQRLVRRNAIVRRLASVETLGSTTVICADKTGTLTENVITVRVFVLDGEAVEVTGAGYDPTGKFLVDGVERAPGDDPQLRMALQIGALCNNATVERSPEDGWHSHGDPIEAALLVAALKAGIDPQHLAWEQPRIGEIPFEERRRSMVTFNATSEGETLAYVKGAPTLILGNSSALLTAVGERSLTASDRAHFENQNQALASRGLRVLGLAYKRLSSPAQMIEEPTGLTFVGLVGMSDPLRPSVKRSVRRSREAGIRTIMITGDQIVTATAVATELGLTSDGPVRALEASQLQGLEPSRYREVLSRVSVFARVTPEDKLRIVKALQETGEIVAMTGDGINDAPALRAAHIGIALGAKAADVAKEAADVVITDENFSTIVLAIEQGRTIYANIRRAIQFLLTASFATILAVLFAIPLDVGLPLLPLQILWLNLLVHVFPAIALSLERGDPDAMRRPPRDPREPILPWGLLASISSRSALVGLAAAGAFYWAVTVYGVGNRPATFAFAVLSLALMLHMLNLRANGALVRRNGRPANPYIWMALGVALVLQALAIYLPGLQQVLRTVPLTPRDLLVVFLAGITPFVLIEVWKVAGRRGQ